MKYFIVALLVLFSYSPAQIQKFGSLGQIDWAKREITAVGIGAPNPSMPGAASRPMAIQAARKIALRNALEILKNIQIGPKQTVADLMSEDANIKTSISGFINNFTESSPRYMSDKTIEISVTLLINDQIMSTILPREITDNPAANYNSAKKSTEEFTGLIIMTDHLGFKSSLAPKIWSKDDKEVFGHSHISKKSALDWGVVGYAKSENDAQSDKSRIGEKPLVIKASGLKNGNFDIVVSKEDADLIRSAAKEKNFLAAGKWIIVVKD